MKNEVDGRREIASRNTAWANNIARKLTRWGVTPNQISMMSVFFAMIGCLLLIGTGGKKSANGDLYNDMPDRFADALFIIPVGYVAGGFGVELGWLGALLAVMTAYFRWIGAYKTHQHFFNGPMAKQHRMALLTLTFVVATCTIHSGYDRMVCFIALIIINIGLIATLIHRLYLMSHTTNTEIK